MNAMAQALHAAGVKTPSQMQRIWTALRDTHRTPGMTSADVMKATGIQMGNVSSILTDMKARGMVSVVREPRIPTPLAGPKTVMYYKAVGLTYELKPRKYDKHSTKTQERKEAAHKTLNQIMRERLDAMPIAKPVEHKEAAPRTVVTLRRPIRIDDWTIAEAREVYNKLKGMFA